MAKRSKYFRQNWFIINRFKTVTFNPFCTDDKSKGSLLSFHCVKSVQIRSFFWLEYRKTRTRKNSVYTDFSRSVIFITADCDITRNSSETYKGKTELQEKWTQRKKKESWDQLSDCTHSFPCQFCHFFHRPLSSSSNVTYFLYAPKIYFIKTVVLSFVVKIFKKYPWRSSLFRGWEPATLLKRNTFVDTFQEFRSQNVFKTMPARIPFSDFFCKASSYLQIESLDDIWSDWLTWL